ncbi:MAG: DUF3137 domain-containing protein [Patescibacteria group bacterium]
MQIKARYPNEETLVGEIDRRVPELLQSLRQALESDEAEYIRQKGKFVLGIVFAVAGFILFTFFTDGSFGVYDSSPPLFFSLLFLSCLLAGTGGWWIFKAGTFIAKFNKKLNALLFPLVFSLFDLKSETVGSAVEITAASTLADISLTDDQAKKEIVLNVLAASELVTEPHNTNTVDDAYETRIGGKHFQVTELDLSHQTGSGKNRHVKHIFKGYFASFELDRTLVGKTFVSTEGDKHGFGHRSFWKSLAGAGALTTELEWNDFEKLLHVATTDPIEARYVLSTDFMSDLHNWWQGRKANIRISFIGNQVYLLYPDNKIRLGRSVGRLTDSEVSDYTRTIAVPLLHVLYLIEDVEKQFNHPR